MSLEHAHDIVWVDIDKIKLNPYNTNKHPKEQITRLAKIIKYQGWRWPLLVWKERDILGAGEGRYLAAKELGLKQVPVSYQSFDNDDQFKAFVTSDNAIASWAEIDKKLLNEILPDMGPDFDIELLGLKDFELEPSDKYKDKDADAIPEVAQNELGVKLGDIYQLGEHRLMCGDSTDKTTVEKLMNGEKADMVFTSPPYSDQREYNGDKNLDIDFLVKFIMPEYADIFCINLGYQRKNGEVFSYWDRYISYAKETGLKFLSWNIWNKGEAGSIGNQTAMFAISHEWIFVFGKETKKLNKTILNKNAGEWNNHSNIRNTNGSITKGKNRFINSHSQLKTVYDCVPQKARDNINHPARFSVDFPIGYINALTDNNGKIYDPFGGSGSTLIACEKTNRKCYMMELDPHYCSMIIKRWQDFTGKKAVKLNKTIITKKAKTNGKKAKSRRKTRN